jgi:hypothetical protein
MQVEYLAGPVCLPPIHKGPIEGKFAVVQIVTTGSKEFSDRLAMAGELYALHEGWVEVGRPEIVIIRLPRIGIEVGLDRVALSLDPPNLI